MKYNPLNETYDLVITGRDILVQAMKLFAGYCTTEYHKFESVHQCMDWLQLDVNRFRTRICCFLSMDQIRTSLPRIYYTDLLGAEPIQIGGWRNPPKFLVGGLAVYMPNIFIPMFPIYTGSHGNDYCIIGNGSCGLYRALSVDRIKDREVGIS